MNWIIIAVAMIVVFIMIFVAFSAEDREDEIGYLAEDELTNKTEEPKKEIVADKTSETDEKSATQIGAVADRQNNGTESIENEDSMFQQISDEEEKIQNESKGAEITRIHSISKPVNQELTLLDVGSEDDLRLRMELKNGIAKPVASEKTDCVAVVVQLRFPDEVIKNSSEFVKILYRAERVFDKEFTFPFATYQSSQFNRVWIFEPSEDRDVIVEALIDAYEATIRFRKALESDSVLNENKVRIGIGVSGGSMTIISRGVNSEPTLFGRPVYLAETLAEIVSDFGIYVDSNIHNATIPLFDFREWKPTVIRATLPAIPLFELVGWNKADEIATYVKHEDASARKSVAIAYRYFELDDLHPLIELMSDSDQSVVLEAIETISFIGSDKMNGALKLRLPEATNPDIKSKIIEAFGNAGNQSVLPVVMASTKENSWKVRLAATKALYKLGGNQVLTNLEAMLNDPDSIVRVVTNNIFYEETNQKEFFDALVDFLGDASKRARATAVDCLMKIGTDQALKAVTNVFMNQEFDLQKHILNLMVESKSKILYQCFLTLFKNSNEALRPYIVEAVRRAGIVN